MVCDAEQDNLKPTGGKSGLRPICVAASVGFFIGDRTMKRISLTQGKFAIVDDEDFEKLSKYRWYAYKVGNTFYAGRNFNKRPNQRRISMHRFIMKTPDGMDTDHRNMNGLNNQKHNLRICTKTQNNQHRKPDKNSSSKYKGVCWQRNSKKWQAHCKRIYLGLFSNEIEAAKVYDKAAQRLYGEFAYLNFR